VLRELLDEELLRDDQLVDRLAEELGEAGHVDALLVRVEVDVAVDDRGDERVAPVVLHADGLLDAGDADARQPQADLGARGLQIGLRGYSPSHVATVAVSG
jgi:hypothetical protein